MTSVHTTGKVALLLLLCATTAAGFLWLPPAAGFQSPALARIVVFHVPCSIVASLASLVAAAYAIAYVRRRDLRDDIKSHASFALGLVFWVLTTVTGAVFARVQWGSYWNWDVKQGAILLLLLINVAYFALRAAFDEPRKRAMTGAIYALFAFLSVPYLTYILPNSTGDTLHPKGVINTRDGLSPEYKLVLWGGVLGLTLVYLWAFRLHVALDEMQLRLSRRARAAAPPATVTRLMPERGQ